MEIETEFCRGAPTVHGNIPAIIPGVMSLNDALTSTGYLGYPYNSDGIMACVKLESDFPRPHSISPTSSERHSPSAARIMHTGTP